MSSCLPRLICSLISLVSFGSDDEGGGGKNGRSQQQSRRRLQPSQDSDNDSMMGDSDEEERGGGGRRGGGGGGGGGGMGDDDDDNAMLIAPRRRGRGGRGGRTPDGALALALSSPNSFALRDLAGWARAALVVSPQHPKAAAFLKAASALLHTVEAEGVDLPALWRDGLFLLADPEVRAVRCGAVRWKRSIDDGKI